MKKTLLFLLPFWLAGTGLQAQLTLNNLNLNNAGCGYFDQQLVTLGPLSNSFVVGTSPTSGYQFISANQIHITATSPNTFHAGAVNGSTGKFHAFILNQQLPAAIIEPQNTSAVPRYSKVELGVDLSAIPGSTFDSRINTFLNSTNGTLKPGTSGYNSAYAARTILNPYDPDHISVDAVFYRPSSPNANGMIRYGFFYRNYTRVGSQNNVTDWNPSTNASNDNYEWRIRFTPDEVGVWNGYINVWVDNAMLPQTYAFSFTVVSSSNPGNVAVDNAHPRYLKFTGNNSTYFPVGDNYCWTRESYGSTNAINCDSPNGYPADHRIFPTINYELETYLNAMAGGTTGGGGNATRIIMAPWGLQIEREKLDNYDTRQVEMWEMDNAFKLMEARGVYCILTLNLGVELGYDDAGYDSQYTNYSEHWNWHPYVDQTTTGLDPLPADNDAYTSLKGITGVNDPIEFFTDANAKAFFKKRLRYISSRWGYSTAISMYELLSEIDAISINPGYFDTGNPASANAIANWHDEMYDYLRNVLGDPHIRTGTFMGDTYHGSDNGSILWNKPNIDMVSGHMYGMREFTSRFHAQETRNVLGISQYNNKPLLVNENDAYLFASVTQMSDWMTHNLHWSTAFSGTCGSGLSWDWNRYYRWYNDLGHQAWNYGAANSYKGEYEVNYKALRDFMSNIDFRNYDYVASETHKNYNAANPPTYQGMDNKFETFYLRRSDNQAIYGWLHNRSFNQFTCDSFLNPMFEGNNTYNSISYLQNSSLYNPGWCNDPLSNNTPCGESSYFGYTSPQFSVFNDDSYNSLFGTSYNPSAQSAGYFYIPGLNANADYKVEWFWSWGTSGGQTTGSSAIYQANNNGVLVVNNGPPTGLVGNVNYPGDWAFVVTALPPRLAGAAPEVHPAQLSAYPNPSSGVFTLQSDLSATPASIEVLTIDGRIIRSENSDFVHGYKLDLSNEAEGVYFIKVTRGGQSKTIRIVKTAQ